MEHSTSQYATINGLNMYYEVHGSGEPLVMLHGQFATAGMFAPFVAELSKNHQDIIRTEHAEEMAKAMNTEVIVVPGDHVSYISFDTALLLQKLKEFLS